MPNPLFKPFGSNEQPRSTDVTPRQALIEREGLVEVTVSMAKLAAKAEAARMGKFLKTEFTAAQPEATTPAQVTETALGAIAAVETLLKESFSPATPEAEATVTNIDEYREASIKMAQDHVADAQNGPSDTKAA